MAGELQIGGWRRLIGFGILGLLTGGAGAAAGQAIPLENRPFDEQTLRPRGQGIVPIFDGWYRNEDGSSNLCFGYYSLNTEEAVDCTAPGFLDTRLRYAAWRSSYCTAPGFLDTRLRYAAWRSSYCSRASLGVRYASFSRRQHCL